MTLSIPLALMATIAMGEIVEIFEVGKETIYFNKKPIEKLNSIRSEIKQKNNNSFFLILCTNGSYDKLIDLMSYLKENGVNKVTLQSPQAGNEC